MELPLGLASVHDERRLLKWIFGVGVGILTIALAFTNMTGAWVETKSFWFTGLALGAEIMLVAAFSLIVLAETRVRQVVGAVVFCGLAYFCVENGKAAVKHWMSDVFVDSPEALSSRAELADAEAAKLDSLPADTKGEANEQRRLDREELAALRVEQRQMQAQDKQGIETAQIALKTTGAYRGPIDGIRADLTEAAMEQRGSEITARVKVLQAKLEEDGAQGAAVLALAPAQAAREQAIVYRTQAKEVGEREWWAQILLLVAEAARSFGVWAFLMAGTRESARYGRRYDDRDEDVVEEGGAADATPKPERTQPDTAEAEAPAGPEAEAETQAAPEEGPANDAAPQDEAKADAGVDELPVDETPPKRKVGDPEKAGASTAFNHRRDAFDDSLPVDGPGVADMDKVA